MVNSTVQTVSWKILERQLTSAWLFSYCTLLRAIASVQSAIPFNLESADLTGIRRKIVFLRQLFDENMRWIRRWIHQPLIFNAIRCRLFYFSFVSYVLEWSFHWIYETFVTLFHIHFRFRWFDWYSADGIVFNWIWCFKVINLVD